MRARKVHFNGNAEVMVNFLTQQFPNTYISAFKVLLDLKYPIKDSQIFYDQIVKAKEEDLVKELLFDSFLPGDFGLQSPINALEKFQFNVKTNNFPKATNKDFGYPFGFKNERKNNYESFMTNPYNGYREFTPFARNEFPMENFTPFNSPTNFWPERNMNNKFSRTYMGKNWEFAKDMIGDVAFSLFTDLVSKGWQDTLAYNISREKEIACRNYLPNFNTEFDSKAQFIFASHFILLDKDVKQSFWAAQFFVNEAKPAFSRFTKKEPFTRDFEAYTPKAKKEFTEPIM